MSNSVRERDVTHDRFDAGDPLRGACALGVFAVHAFVGALALGESGAYVPGYFGDAFRLQFGPLGYLLVMAQYGVWVFLTLSGYLISRPFVRAYLRRTPMPSLATISVAACCGSRRHSGSRCSRRWWSDGGGGAPRDAAGPRGHGRGPERPVDPGLAAAPLTGRSAFWRATTPETLLFSATLLPATPKPGVKIPLGAAFGPYHRSS